MSPLPPMRSMHNFQGSREHRTPWGPKRSQGGGGILASQDTIYRIHFFLSIIFFLNWLRFVSSDNLTLVLLNPITEYTVSETVDPDQLDLMKPSVQDPHCFPPLYNLNVAV